MTLAEKLKTIDKPAVSGYAAGADGTIAEFWTNFVEPRLPATRAQIDAYVGWYKCLLRYVDEPDAVFAIRNYSHSIGGKTNYETLRRGFYTITDDAYSFFYTDNHFAAYFLKMAMDGFVADGAELKSLMLSREFPARFGPVDTKFETVKAAYSIDGKKGKNPGFARSGYKIAHIIDAGKNFYIDGQSVGLEDICKLYFPRGEYSDWAEETDAHGRFFVRRLAVPKDARKILTAHFLRFACPFNYVLTPKPSCRKAACVFDETEEFRQYAVEKLRALYGDVYDDYLSRLLLAPSASVLDPGETVIDVDYDSARVAGGSAEQSGFSAYLTDIGKSGNTVYAYCNSIRKVENAEGVTLDLSNIDEYIRKYGNGGERDPADHGTTLNALKRYKEYLLFVRSNDAAEFCAEPMSGGRAIRYVSADDKLFWLSLDKHLSESEFDKKVRDGQGYILSLDGRPIGILRYNLFWDNTPFCTMLFVDAAYRGAGHGRALTEHWEAEMRERGYETVLVSTRSDEAAQHFYRKLGYDDCGSLIVPEQPTELFLSKTLKRLG